MKPQKMEKENVQFRNKTGYVKTFDDLGECFVKHRAACNDFGDIRIEKMKIYPELRILSKDVTYGKQMIDYGTDYKNVICVKNRMNHVLDFDSGNVVQWSADAHPLRYEDNWLSAGVNSSTPSKIYLPDDISVYKTDKLNYCFPSYDLTAVQTGIESTEDILQMSYTHSVGFLMSFFTQWSYGFPFDSYVIIDTDTKKFNIPNFKYLDIIDRETGLNLYAYYFKCVSEMADVLCRNCYFWKRKLRIYIFTSAYSTVMKIRDLDGQGIELDYNLNASDHLPAVISNIEAGGEQFIVNEENWIVLKTKLGDITDQIITSYDHKKGMSPF